jgi:exodeoxyribonuclease III
MKQQTICEVCPKDGSFADCFSIQKPMKIITYNVNGLRAAVGKGLPRWLSEQQPDVLCLQETKLQPEQYPAEVFEELGYKAYLFSAQKKGYSGVAILTKKEPDQVVRGMGIRKYDNEGRFIRADYGDISVVSVYHPSGTSGDERQAFKMEWLEDFQRYVVELQKTRKQLILCGDYNICHEPIDIHDPVRNANNSGFLPEEREWMTRFLDAGFIDTFRYLNPDKQQYTWWSYRFNARKNNKGWRIDYCMVSEPVKPLIQEAYILGDAVHSDHCPAVLVIK